MKIGKLLCFFSAFCTAFLLTICSFDSVPVFADGDPVLLQLTYQQTLALYGSSFDVQYYNSTSGITSTLHFNYCCTTSDWAESDSLYRDTPWRYVDAFRYENGSYINNSNFWYTQPCLVYGAAGGYSSTFGSGPLYSSETWYGQFSPNDTGNTANILINFPINLTGIDSFHHNIFYTAITGTFGYNNTNCYGFLHTPDSMYTTRADSYGSSGNSAMLLSRGVMPTRPPDLFSPVPVESKWLGRFSGIIQNIDSESSFTASSEEFTLQNVYPLTGLTGENLYGTTFYGDNFGVVYILIGCPQLSGYVPPVVTTTTVQTTNPYNFNTGTGYTHQTVDLSNLESGVAAIVQQEQYNGDTLDWIGNNTMITANNLAYIANTLDAIYNRMVESGQIAVNLVPADPLRALDTNVHNQIHDNLSSFTTAQIPNDVVNGFSFYNDLFSRFTTGDLAFFGWLGIFSLVTLTLGWFLFKGRG